MIRCFFSGKILSVFFWCRKKKNFLSSVYVDNHQKRLKFSHVYPVFVCVCVCGRINIATLLHGHLCVCVCVCKPLATSNINLFIFSGVKNFFHLNSLLILVDLLEKKEDRKQKTNTDSRLHITDFFLSLSLALKIFFFST